MTAKVRTVIASLVLAGFGMSCFGADPITVKIEPYTKDEFPQWARDLRRTEIVTLGSLPFVALGVALGYSVIRYVDHDMDPDYAPNPFAKTVSGLSTDEQLDILFISLGVSALFGLTDLTINLIKRHNTNKQQNTGAGAITVTPLQAIPPQLPEGEPFPETEP
jgi:hypothetical protein